MCPEKSSLVDRLICCLWWQVLNSLRSYPAHVCVEGDFNVQRLWTVTGTWMKVLRQEEPDQYFLCSWHATVDSLSPYELLTLVMNRWGFESFQFAPGMLSKMYPIFINSTLFRTTFQRVQWKISIILITDSELGNHQLWMNTFCLTKRPPQNTACRFTWYQYCWLVILFPVNWGSNISASSFLGTLLLSCLLSSRFGVYHLLVQAAPS